MKSENKRDSQMPHMKTNMKIDKCRIMYFSLGYFSKRQLSTTTLTHYSLEILTHGPNNYKDTKP